MSDKVSKGKFLKQVSKRSGVSIDVVTNVYHAFVAEIEDIMMHNGRLSLTGFGAFYLQRHRGHPVQFETNVSKVPDYVVFKFSASNAMNRKFRNWDMSQKDDNRKKDKK